MNISDMIFCLEKIDSKNLQKRELIIMKFDLFLDSFCS